MIFFHSIFLLLFTQQLRGGQQQHHDDWLRAILSKRKRMDIQAINKLHSDSHLGIIAMAQQNQAIR